MVVVVAYSGAMVLTGMTLTDFYGALAAYGAGFEFSVGLGIMVHAGFTFHFYTAWADEVGYQE